MVDIFTASRGVFYPSLVCNLQILFDEGATFLSPVSADDLATVPVPAPPTTGPAIFATAGGPVAAAGLTQVLGLVPKLASVELSGYRQAGTFTLMLPYKDLPIDPRTVRAMGVAIHLDAVDPGDFSDGMTETQAQLELAGRLSSVIQTNSTNLLLTGTADGIDTEWSSSGHYIRIEGRDLRGILLDTSISAKTLSAINLMLPIDQVVQQIVNGLHPQGAGITVAVDPTEWNGPIPSPGVVGDATRVNLDAQTGATVVTANKGEAHQLKFWDIITQYCFLVGAVPHLIGSTLRLRPARSLYDAQRQEKSFDPAVPTPFLNGAPRQVRPPLVQVPETFAFRRIVFGRDIESLKMERKLGGVKTPIVKCVSIDHDAPMTPGLPGLGKLIEGQYPPVGSGEALATNVGPGGGVPQSEILTVPVPGIKSPLRLAQIAQDLREEIGRQEMGGSIQTKNLSSFGGDNQDPDLLRLRPGDPIELRTDASGLADFPPPISEFNDHSARSFEEEVQAVKERVGDAVLARAIVQSNRSSVLQNVFRTSNVKFDWNNDSGVAIAFDFQNYFESRNSLTPVPTLTPPAGAG